ncbi:MAG TPA: hypothetical protein VFA09_07385 [Ktedonobacteraceae bacterium]|jgi:uncharacterized membrane protein YedE/YeeE|nr:hypothetical protein [Ktedonosporobacter sp.]HZU67085.1 hypothetical protein [Ktedonobacteraceae bacterium]
MADQRDEDIVLRAEALDRAERAKRKKYTWRGLVLLFIGIVLVGLGVVLNTGPASSEGLFVALGVIVLIASIISFLIGLINPFITDVIRFNRKRPSPPEAEEVEQP